MLSDTKRQVINS